MRVNSSGNVDGAMKVLQDAVYAFNERNNITRIDNSASEYTASYTYGYDGLSRLTDASGSYVEIQNATGTADTTPREFRHGYSYSPNGNLTAKRTLDTAGAVMDEWAYNYQNHRVQSIDSTKSGSSAHVMGYDASGNMVSQRDAAKGAAKSVEFDSQNRITRVRDAKTNALVGNYSYDDGGFRVRRQARFEKNGLMTDVEILYPSKFYGLEYVAENNTLQSINNVYLNGLRIAALNEEGATAYYLTDQVDSVSHVLDDTGRTLTRIQYRPYGETFVQTGNLDFTAKYNSQELDRESNFYFYNARYYDPGIARFTSADSVIPDAYSTQSWNRFSYVRNNPISYKDPTGHEEEGSSKKAAALDKEMKERYLIKQDTHALQKMLDNRGNYLCDVRNCGASTNIMVLMSHNVVKDKKELGVGKYEYLDEYMDLDIPGKPKNMTSDEDTCATRGSGGKLYADMADPDFGSDHLDKTAPAQALSKSAIGEKRKIRSAVYRDNNGGNGIQKMIWETQKAMDNEGEKFMPELYRARVRYEKGGSVTVQSNHNVAAYYNPYSKKVMILDPLPGAGGPYENGSSSALYGKPVITEVQKLDVH